MNITEAGRRNDLNTLPWAPNQIHVVDNYWEAVGVMTALNAGITPSSLRRPAAATHVEKKTFESAQANQREKRPTIC